MSGSSTTISGAAGGLLQDTTGNTVIDLGSQPASILAGLGTDTIVGGSAGISVFAANDLHNLDVQGGAGTLVVSLLDLSGNLAGGNATLTGGTAGETVTGGYGNIAIAQSGSLALHPANGTIDITADGRPITIWASDNSGYEVFTPIAGTTVIVAPTSDGYGHTEVTIGNSETVALGNGFETIGSSIAYLTGASSSTFGNPIIPAPATPVVSGLTPATDTGVSATDGITADTQPAFTGTAPAGDQVVLYLDGYTEFGTSVANAQGKWTITPAAGLSGGTHSITAEAIDISGVPSNFSNAYSVVIDTAGPGTPVITGLDASTDSGTIGDSLTNIRNVKIDGTSDPNDTIVLYDGANSVGSGVANSSGTWSVTSTVALTDGAHDLTAVATDPAGLTGTTSSIYVVTIQTTSPLPPTGVILDPGSDSGVAGDDLTNVTSPKIDGAAPSGETIRVSADGTILGTVTADNSGDWSYAITSVLTAGTHVVTANAIDDVGNISTAATLDLTIEPTAPAPVITGAVAATGTITAGHLTNAGTVTLSGTTTPGATLAIIDGSTTIGTVVASGSGTWSDNVALALGENTLTAMVHYDAAGNSNGPASAALVLDAFPATPTAPAITGLAAGSDSGTQGDQRTDIATPTLVGTGTAGELVTVLSGNSVVATGTVGTTGTWSVTIGTALPVGATTTLTATVTDIFGTTSSRSTGYALTIDPTPAQPAIALTAGGTIAGSAEPQFTITSGDSLADTFTIYDNGTQIGLLAAPQQSSPAVFTPSTPLPIGSDTIVAVASNSYGDLSNAGTVVITVQPAAPTLDPASDSGTPGDDRTNVSRPQIDGTATANAHVTVLDNGGSIGVTTASASGAWTFTPTSALGLGGNTIVAMVTLGNNTTIASNPLDLTIQTAAPTPAITAAVATNTGTVTVADLTNTGTITLSGTAEQGATIIVMDNGVIQSGSAIVNGAGAWSETLTVQQGLNTLTAEVSDDSTGNSSAPSAPLVLTAYPAAPAAPAISGLAAADTGGEGGALTAVTSPTLTGTGLAQETVTLLQGGTVIGTGTVASSGTWAVAVGTSLAVGQHVITAEQSDPFGRSSAVSASYTVTIEPVSAPSLDAASQSGSSTSITKITTPRIDGVATPNASVVLVDNGGTIGSTTADSAGNWSLQPSAPLLSGANTLVAMVVVANGDTVASSPFVLTIQTSAAAPTITLAAASDSGVLGDDLTNVTMPTLLGAAPDNGTVRLADNGTLLATVTASAQGAWSYTPTAAFASGNNLITGVATDVAGNISAAGSLYLTIETSVAPPAILSFSPNTGLVPANNDTGASTITLYGTAAAAGSEVIVYDNGTELTEISTSNGQWTLAATPTLGTNSYTAEIASDPAGNASSLSSAFVVTRLAAPPSPTISGLATGSDSGVVGDGITNVTRPSFTGTGAAGDLVSLQNAGSVIATGTVNSNGNWSITAASTLANGTYTVNATVTNAADTVSPASASCQFTIDTTPPAAPTVALAPAGINPVLGSFQTDARMPGLQGTAAANDQVRVYDGGTLLGTVTASAQGTWSYTPTVQLPIGTQEVSATVTDDVGNISATGTLGLTITTVPTAAPTLTLAPASDSGTVGDLITNVTQPELTGTAPAGDTVVITSNNTVAGSVTAAASGLWTYTFAGSLGNGSYVLQATATDPVSGATATSSDNTLQIDTTPPAAPVITGVNGAVTNNGTSVVSSSNPTITGTGPASDLITVFDNGAVIATTSAAADGSWSLQTSLSSSNNTLTAEATDVAGNASAQSAPLVVSTAQLQTLAINLPSSLISAATPAVQQAVGSGWSSGTPINVTTYTPGNTPPDAAAGTVLALSVGDANDNQVVTVPNGTNVVSDTADGAVTLAGGGNNQLFLAASNGTTTFVSNGGSGVYLANQAAGGNTNGNNMVFITDGANGTSGNYVVDTSSGTNVIEALAGNDTIAGGTGADTISIVTGNDFIQAIGTDVISCDSVAGGSDTVNAGSDPNIVKVFQNLSSLTFLGGPGQSVIVGGTLPMNVVGWAGSDTVWGSSGGGQYWGGQAGSSYLEAGAGAGSCTLAGGNGDNNALFAANAADDVLAAGGGYETLGGADATGNNQFFSGSGNTVILAGHGDDTVSMAAGNSTVFAGSNTLTFANAPGYIVASSGNQTIMGGGPSEIYLFRSDLGGGNTIIDNFNPAQDQIAFWNYSGNDINAALAAQTNSGGNTFVTLSDNTRISFMGLQQLNSSSVSTS